MTGWRYSIDIKGKLGNLKGHIILSTCANQSTDKNHTPLQFCPEDEEWQYLIQIIILSKVPLKEQLLNHSAIRLSLCPIQNP
jgi:hypothetical protein